MDKFYLLQLPTKELQNALKNLKQLVNKIKPKPSYPIVDVIVKIDQVELRLIGMSRFIKATNKNIYSFTIPLNELYAVAFGTPEDVFDAKVSEGMLKIDIRTYNSAHISIKHPENVLNLGLTINNSVMDILSLRYRFTEEELEEKDYLRILENEEEKMKQTINDAVRKLSPYGITHTFIENYIEDKIKLHAKSF